MPLAQVKIFRIFRVVRVYRLLRKFGMRGIIRELMLSKGNGAVYTIFFLVICVLEFGSILILAAESYSNEANITTSSDALWWIMATITTVGYGDVFPVTNYGRMVGVLVMVIGIGLFSTIAGFLANAFITPKKS
jgi:voltage-gated potassium channel Kch